MAGPHMESILSFITQSKPLRRERVGKAWALGFIPKEMDVPIELKYGVS